MGLFGPSLPIPLQEVEWQLATFGWLARAFPEPAHRPLVTPTDTNFPVASAAGHARARALFEATRTAAGMAAWDCELREGKRSRPAQVGDTLLLSHDREPPAGTFHWEPGAREPRAVITYNPDGVERPMTLVATFAHELGHLLLSATADPPPGGPDLEELATDIAAVFLGFGIFQANSAFSFGQFQDSGAQGWASQRLGYLSEPALLVALAIFQGLNGGTANDAARWLKPGLRKPYVSTVKGVARRYPDIPAAVRAADPGAFG